MTPATTTQSAAVIVGSGRFRYRALDRWQQLPAGWDLVEVAGVATDSQDRVYVFNRGEHPVVVFDRQGNGWQELEAGGWGVYPADGLAGVGLVGGRQVRCLTAELQVRHHLGYPLGASDRHDLRLLAERFGVAVPPAVQRQAGGDGSPAPGGPDAGGAIPR